MSADPVTVFFWLAVFVVVVLGSVLLWAMLGVALGIFAARKNKTENRADWNELRERHRPRRMEVDVVELANELYRKRNPDPNSASRPEQPWPDRFENE